MPVGTAEVAQFARFHLGIQRIDDRRHRRGRVVAVQPIQIDVISAQMAQARVDVADDVAGRQAGNVHRR